MTCTTNIDLLTPNGFKFSIQKYPELDYFIQGVQLPAIGLGEAVQVSSVHDMKMPGETLTFDDLTITFMVDSQMKNYLAIQEWMFGLGFPVGHAAFTSFVNEARNAQSYTTISKSVSDCSLMILGTNNQIVKQFNFIDAFPTSLSAINVGSTNTDVNYVEATVVMTYSYYSPV